VVPTVPSQSLPALLYVFVGSKVLSARPTKSCKRPYVVGHVSVRPAVTQVKFWSKKSHSGSSSRVTVEKEVESSRPSLYCVT